MPTSPLPSLLDRDASRAAVSELADIAVPLIEEVVNHGTNAYARCSAEVRSGVEHIAMFHLYYHALETADAVSIQLAAGAPHLTFTQLRSALEAVVAMQYI